MKEYQLFIGGSYKNSRANTLKECINPATNTAFAKVHLASKEDIEEAIAAASRAQKIWAKTTPRHKEAVLLKQLTFLREDARSWSAF